MSGANRRARLAAARLYLVAPRDLTAGSLPDLIARLAEAGVDLVQLRDRSLGHDALRQCAAACADAARRAGVLFIVNDDPGLARAVGADGVHLGQTDGSPSDARSLLGAEALIGRSTRGGELLARAHAEGADYAAVGPVWETPTKPGRTPIGFAPLRPAADEAQFPWFAIGGIDSSRLGRVAAHGAERIVVVRAITEAADPVAAARDLRARLTEATPRVLSVAGSDSGGGAGIQADVKAISRTGAFPMTAVTALTAQTTRGVSAVHPAPPEFVTRQIREVADDIGLDSIKTGMLADAELVEAVSAALREVRRPELEIPLIVDTVLRAESGAPLMAAGGERALVEHLLPQATVITPNLMEAQALTARDSDDAAELARRLNADHGCAVIVTGGHGPSADDLLCNDGTVVRIPGVRLPRVTTHGAGCTHSSTLAALLARGWSLERAATGAKAAATGAVAGGRPFGAGAGPVDVTGVKGPA